MMWRVAVGAALILFSSTSAMATRFGMELKPGPQQASRMVDGDAAIDDSTPGSSVRLIEAEGDLKKRGSIELLVMNQGGQPFNFGPENVTAALADGAPVPIVTYGQLIHEEKRREMWAAIAAGLSAAGNSMSAASSGYYSGMGTYSGSTFGTFGGTPYSAITSGTVMVSGYDYGRAQAAQSAANAENQATFDRMAEQNSTHMQALKGYMRTTTVDPKQMFGGTVMFDLPKEAREAKTDVPVMFVVTIDGEQHKFSAVLKRR
jgi:hypothetical protein